MEICLKFRNYATNIPLYIWGCLDNMCDIKLVFLLINSNIQIFYAECNLFYSLLGDLVD